MTTDLIRNHKKEASAFYRRTLNEEQIEIWLHRAFENMTYENGRTTNPEEANVFLVPYYGHLWKELKTEPAPNDFANILLSRLHNKSKPHLFLCPSNNSGRSRIVGIADVMKVLRKGGVNIWSVGIERNVGWQSVEPERIIPIPYMVKPNIPLEEILTVANHSRIPDSVFYAGNARPNAVKWAGCNRSMVLPLRDAPNMTIHVHQSTGSNLSQAEYNQHMLSSEYCLVLCGDTPTSRSLASSVVHGCIPVRVGSRLRGLCQRPCHRGFGWKVTGLQYQHLPYPEKISWDKFPEVNEAEFVQSPEATLRRMFSSYSPEAKAKLRSILLRSLDGWIYGLGDPATSTEFGNAATYIMESFLFVLQNQVPA